MDTNLELLIRSGYSTSSFVRQTESLRIWVENTLEELCYHDELIHGHQVRKKTIDSLLKKVKKQVGRGEKFTDFESVIQNINDLIGSRIMVYLPSRIKKVHDTILDLPRFKILSVRIHRHGNDDNNVSTTMLSHIEESINHKQVPFTIENNQTGYFGIHYIIKPEPVDEFYRKSEIRMFDKFELQLRTLTHHAWSEVQHKAIYKSESSDDKIEYQLAEIATLINFLDSRLESITGLALASPSLPRTKIVEQSGNNPVPERLMRFQQEVSEVITSFENREINLLEFKEIVDNTIEENSEIINRWQDYINDSNSVYAILVLGELYLKSGKFKAAHEFYQRISSINLQGNSRGKVLLRMAETNNNLGDDDEAINNIRDLEKIVISNDLYKEPENYALFAGSALLSWQLKLYNSAVYFGTQALELGIKNSDLNKERKLKYALNLIYYKIDSSTSATSFVDDISQYIAYLHSADISIFRNLIDDVRKEVNLANSFLDEGTHADSSMYDSLSWYYLHEAWLNYLSGDKINCQRLIEKSSRYHKQCYSTWGTEEIEIQAAPRNIWKEHGLVIKKINEELTEFYRS